MAQIDAAPIKSAIFTMVAVLTATVITTNAREKTETATLSIPTVDISSERDRHRPDRRSEQAAALATVARPDPL